jgi:F420H(2)-dependent quinone reductase
MGVFKTVSTGVNAVVAPMIRSPRLTRVVGRSFAMVTYTGRRSGGTFTTPVFYSRKGDNVTIRVAMADQKQWWRNFSDGGPISLLLAGVEHQGRAVSERDAKGRVTVRVQLDG